MTEGLKAWNRYQDNAVVITVDKDFFSWTLFFPSATICYSQLVRSEKEYKLLKAQYPNLPVKLSDAAPYLEDLAFKNYYDYHEYEKYANGSVIELLNPEEYQTAMNLMLPVTGPSKSKRSKLAFSYPMNQERPFFRIFTEKGPCSIFNPEVGIYYTDEFLNVTTPYENFTNIEYTKSFFPTWTVRQQTDASFSICFHASTEIVQITDKCIVSQQQRFRSSRFEVTNVWTSPEVKELSLRQRKCRFPHEAENLRHSPVYSYNLCRIECRIELCLKYCQCTPYYYRRLPGEPICNMTGMYCLSKHVHEIVSLTKAVPGSDKNVSICPCLQNCDSTVFSEAEILRDQLFLLQSVMEMFITYPNTAYVRQVIFSITDLIVQIGGIFGLFLGCSILSLIEILYFTTLRLFWAMRDRV